MFIPPNIEEYITAEYLNKLSGQTVYDQRFLNTYKIDACSAILNERFVATKMFPSSVRYRVSGVTNRESDIPYLVVVNLIEKGEAQDSFGYKYKIVK